MITGKHYIEGEKMKSIMIAIGILAILLVAGCAQRAETAKPAAKKITSFEECAAAGNPVMESYPRQCRADGQTFTEEITVNEPENNISESCKDSEGNALSLDDAKAIAKDSECGDRLITSCTCPEGYRQEGDSCNPECYYSEPKCLRPSVQCEKSYFCNENTGTFWIGLDIKKEGCNPACVVKLADKTAEINWRCTGLVAEEPPAEPRLIGGQKDEHGCLIPAGYSWCESKQKCLRQWEEPCRDGLR